MASLLSPDNPVLVLRELRRHDFLAFLERAWVHINGGQMLMFNWHIDALAHQLDLVATGRSRRMMINLPPRNGKSNIVSIAWVAWMLGQDPSLSFVCVSYSNELSAKLARDCLSIMQSGWYREIFPATHISRLRSASYDFETTRGGGRLSTSVGGTLTGRGGDIIILDDVIKPEDAWSDSVREAVNEWYRRTLVSRLNDKTSGAILCVMQRLHQYDLPGMLLEAGVWDHLVLPAIASEDTPVPLTRGRTHQRRSGEVLHPEREPHRVLEDLRAAMGSTAFEAQYQQAPVPAQGNVFKDVWLKTWPDTFDPQGHGEIIQSWDTGIKTGEDNSYSVCVTALLRDRQIFLLDVWRGRLEYPDLRRKVIELARLHNARTLLLEDKASGQELIQELRSQSFHGVPAPIARNPISTKFSRAQGSSSIVEAGQLFLPPEAHWLGEFQSELLGFPSTRFDDQVDALSQLLEWVRERWSVPRPTIAGPEMWSEDEGFTGGDWPHVDVPASDDPWAA